MMAEYGWLLVPVRVEENVDTENPASFEFDNFSTSFDSDDGGAWGYISTDDAPTFYDALKKMKNLG